MNETLGFSVNLTLLPACDACNELIVLCCSNVVKSFHSESFLIQLRIWNNSSSWFLCSTSRTNISPIRITTSHRSICCNQYLLKSSSNKSCVQQSSTIHIEPSLYNCCGCCGVMFSELFNLAGMPRFLVYTALYSNEIGPKTIQK